MRKKLVCAQTPLMEELEPRTMLSGAPTMPVVLLDIPAFTGTVMNASQFHNPDYYLGGTFYGDTQNVCQPRPLPGVSNGEAMIHVDTYNPTGFSYFGYRPISNITFSAGQGFDITAKIRVPVAPGTVAAFYVYTAQEWSGNPNTNDNEVDFEILGNSPQGVETNDYGNVPLGAGNPQFVNYANNGTIDQLHTYELRYTVQDGVTWLIDNATIRHDGACVLDPTAPLTLQLSDWVANSGGFGYNSSLPLPVHSASQNSVFTMYVDSVKITTLPVMPVAINFTSVPELGYNGSVTGIATGIRPAEWNGAAYIRVNGNWWTKPTEAQPLTTINADGTFTCLVTTGGNDINASEIRMYLVPSTFTPPLCLGSASLPGSLSAYIYADATRVDSSAWLKNLYADMLGRAPGASGLAFWNGLLSVGTLTKSAVVNNFLKSTEYLTKETQGLYQTALGRTATPTEVSGEITYLSDHTYQQAEAQLYGSAEYASSMPTNDSLVDSYYVAFFGRHAALSGLTFWTGMLANGVSNSAVAGLLLSSNEGITNITQTAFERYLHRTPTPSGLAFWSARLTSSTYDNLIVSLVTTAEYINRN